MSITNGLDALDTDRNAKLATRRTPRPIPAPKKYAPAPEAPAVEEPAVEDTQVASVVDLRDEAPAAVTEPEKPARAEKATPATKTPKAPAKPAEGEKRALRAAQIYMDGPTDDHLRRIKAQALMDGVDVTGSAVVRRAVAEMVERHGYDGIVRLIQDDPIAARGKGRPRR